MTLSYYAEGIAQLVDTDPREYVPIDEIRAAYQALDREALDRLLLEVARLGDYEAVPESNQKALTAEQRAGALWIGGQHKHYLTRVSGF